MTALDKSTPQYRSQDYKKEVDSNKKNCIDKIRLTDNNVNCASLLGIPDRGKSHLKRIMVLFHSIGRLIRLGPAV